MNEPNDEQSSNTQTALVKHEERLDVVPTTIDYATLIKSGQSEQYLVAKCEKHNITLGDLRYLVDLKNAYQTNFPTLIKLVEKGHSVDEIETMLELRTETERERDLLSLEGICRFQERFNLPVDGDCLAHSIYRLIEMLDKMSNYKFSKRAGPSDRAIKLAIKIADDFEFVDVGSVIDYLENPSGPMKKITEQISLFSENPVPVSEVIIGGAICEDYSEDSFP